MSSANAAVLFPDGEIRYGTYHGTSDVMYSGLFDSVRAAWDAKGAERERRADKNHEVYPVVIYSDYGSGFFWEGTATKMALVTGFAPHGFEDRFGRVVLPPCEITEGKPDWLVWSQVEEGS